MNHNRLVLLLEIALMAGIGVILDLFSIRLWPNGGSVSLAMVPIFLIAFRRGVGAGVVTGLLVGLLQPLLVAPFYVHPIQFLLDYPIAFMVVGLAGLFSVSADKTKKKRITKIAIGCFVGSLFRLVTHFLSGVIWFGDMAPEGTPVALYSFLYNASYLFPAAAVSIVVLALLSSTSPKMVHHQ
ncbi:energy-coupled thiamine transporter ThiT [Guptibacillus algicola]|uniref:energy-coupled thiamine transporter ThiT n=1 Tax=Guptibacillus algicola TaxID=225844 RepID=UPI001CD80CD8|nr:energy-coupled thiamine transporter ThiT [Alkalihalobacillus algicola]MCA0988029.1 energy-coupled thiamine transporter ThiT [Alkalihalobacillus algicola]